MWNPQIWRADGIGKHWPSTNLTQPDFPLISEKNYCFFNLAPDKRVKGHVI